MATLNISEVTAPTLRAIRIARWSEGVLALVAALLALSLPVPTSWSTLILWLHWSGIAVFAAVLGWRLRQLTLPLWWAAAFLSAYVLLNSITTLERFVQIVRDQPGPAETLSLAIASLTWISQLIVAVCLYYARRSFGRRTLRQPSNERCS
jgi:hypothetical protein